MEEAVGIMESEHAKNYGKYNFYITLSKCITNF